jgi:cbb3-type cytochrome oxidase subunit 3
MLAFIGIVVWAWSGRSAKSFAEAARLPLDEDGDLPTHTEHRQ